MNKLASKPKAKRGFAAMSRRMARKLQRRGGRAVSRDRKHMRKIARVGARVRNAMYKVVKK